MKKIPILIFLLSFSLFTGFAQQPKVSIYNPDADAKADIKAAVAKASAENKHVLLQIGGNWCPWCVKLHKLFHTDNTIDSTLKADYIFMMVNYSKENKNLPVLKELDFPQRFGFPVLVVLDKTGKKIHTQDTGLLEAGDGYDS
ncbi:MAG TPA: thioredoxin family protein, partial [Bacteroidales bacterium]